MPYDDPFRLRVAKALTASLAAISTDDGYKHDMANRVFRGRLIFGEGDPLPMLSIVEPAIPEDVLTGKVTAQAYGWPLVIQGWVEDDRVNPTDPAQVLLADVRQKLALEQLKTQGVTSEPILGIKRISTLIIGPGVVRPPDTTSEKAYFWLTINLALVEALERPYD